MKITKLEVDLTDEDFTDICDTAGYSIGYWATRGEIDSLTYELDHADGNGAQGVHTVVTKPMVERAIASIVSDRLANDGIVDSIVSLDLGNYDSDVCDVIMQVAIFNKVVFG